MLKAQVESITVKDERRETNTNSANRRHHPPLCTHMPTDMPQIKIESIFSRQKNNLLANSSSRTI